MLKKKGGGRTPWTPPPSGSALDIRQLLVESTLCCFGMMHCWCICADEIRVFAYRQPKRHYAIDRRASGARPVGGPVDRRSVTTSQLSSGRPVTAQQIRLGMFHAPGRWQTGLVGVTLLKRYQTSWVNILLQALAAVQRSNDAMAVRVAEMERRGMPSSAPSVVLPSVLSKRELI